MKRFTWKWTVNLVLSVLLALTIAQIASASSNPVQLISADLYSYNSGSYVSFSGNVEVENVGYQKSVIIHYTTGNGQWNDVSASYVGPTDSTHEKWNFSISTGDMKTVAQQQLKDAQTIQFAINYNVNGQSYWDNNNGNNYSVSRYGTDSTILGAPNVLRSYEYLNQNTFTGNLFLKNLAFEKTVNIIYTTDNWATKQQGAATYKESANSDGSVEVWSFNFDNINPNVSQIKYAISYTVNGQTYWDNNYGNNYTVNR